MNHCFRGAVVQASAVVGEYQLMFREALADGQAREMQCGVLQARAAAAEAEVSSFVTYERFHNAVTYWRNTSQ
jgi:hypothetical protein